MRQCRTFPVIRESGMKMGFKFSISKPSMGGLQSLASSIKKGLKRVKINVSQNSRLSHRIDGIVAKLKTMREGGALAMQHGYFAILLVRAWSLVTECGGSKSVKTALVRGNNTEAYEKLHEELTKFQKYAGFTTTPSPPTMELLNEDAEKDLQEMLKLLWKFGL